MNNDRRDSSNIFKATVAECVLGRRTNDSLERPIFCPGGDEVTDNNRPGPEQQLHNLTPDEARSLIREAVRETFLMLGVKVDDPIEVQKDFQHLREWRTTTDSLKSKGLMALIGILVSGLVAAAWVGFKDLVVK